MSDQLSSIPDLPFPPTAPDEHIVAELVSQLLPAASRRRPRRQPSQAFLARAAAHLAVCGTCRAALDILSTATSEDPTLDALLAHITIEAAPSDQELADYIAWMQDGRSAGIASPISQAAVAHITACQFCSTTVAEVVAVLEPSPLLQVATAPDTAPDTAFAAAVEASASPWQALGARARRFAAPYTITIRRAAVSVACALRDAQIILYPPAPALALRGSAAAVPPGDRRTSASAVVSDAPRDEGFALDLRDDAHSPEPWIRVRVRLHTLYTGSLSLNIAAALVASPDEPGEPATGIAWRLEAQREGAAPRTIISGATRSDGSGGDKFKDTGELMLTFTVEGREWQVPLLVERDHAERSRRQ